MSATSIAELEAVLDGLLPGDAAFPAASAVAIGETVRRRLAVLGGDDVESRLAAALLAAGGPLAPLPPDARAAVLRRLEADAASLFDLVRRVVFLAYYETPGVTAAIRSLGIDYHGAPQPTGYALAAFDPALDAPAGRRGGWKRTEETGPGRSRSL